MFSFIRTFMVTAAGCALGFACALASSGCSSKTSASDDAEGGTANDAGVTAVSNGSTIETDVHHDFFVQATTTAFNDEIQLNESDGGGFATLTGNNNTNGTISMISISIPSQAPGTYNCGFDNPSTDSSMYYQPDEASMRSGYFAPQDDGHDNECSVVVTEYGAHVRGTFTGQLDFFNGGDETYQFSAGSFDIVR